MRTSIRRVNRVGATRAVARAYFVLRTVDHIHLMRALPLCIFAQHTMDSEKWRPLVLLYSFVVNRVF